MRNPLIIPALLLTTTLVFSLGASVPEERRLGHQIVLKKVTDLTDRELTLSFTMERDGVRVAEWVQRIDTSRAKQPSARTVDVQLLSPARVLVVHVVNEMVFLSDVRLVEAGAGRVHTQRLLRRGAGGGAVWEATGARLAGNGELEIAAIDIHGKAFTVTFSQSVAGEDWRVVGDAAPLYE